MDYTLLVPIAGRSTRFPDMRPKWMLTHPNGNLMVAEAVRGLNLDAFDRIVLVGLKEHDERYRFQAGVMEQFEDLGLSSKTEIVLLDEATRHQPETVAMGLVKAGIEGPFCVKDSDNFFRCEAKPVDFVSYCNLDDLALVNASNKSYVVFDDVLLVENIVERNVVSRSFCTGLYGFADAGRFLTYFGGMGDAPDLFISHVIFRMVVEGNPFRAVQCRDYLDWGTLKDWNRFKATYATFFVDVDGVLVHNSGQHFEPRWGTTSSIAENVDALNRLHDSGRVQVILTTSRKSKYREKTLAQLEREGVKYHKILFDMLHGRRIVVNDYSSTNPYRSCDAINLRRDAGDLPAMIEATMGLGD